MPLPRLALQTCQGPRTRTRCNVCSWLPPFGENHAPVAEGESNARTFPYGAPMKNKPAVVLAAFLFSGALHAATFVYVSNADDGDIGVYTLQADGSLKAGERVKAEKVVMPMSVSPDKKYLVAAVRSKPFSAWTYSIDRASGALKLVGSGPL